MSVAPGWKKSRSIVEPVELTTELRGRVRLLGQTCVNISRQEGQEGGTDRPGRVRHLAERASANDVLHVVPEAVKCIDLHQDQNP